VSPDVIVIGAGCAGFGAATSLADRGARVLVAEARPIMGGRASAVTDAATGERLDNGQHVLMGAYDDTFALLRRVGALDRVRVQSCLAVTQIDRGGHATTLKLPPLPAPLHLLAGVLAWDAIDWTERWAILRAGSSLRAQRASRSPDAAGAQTVREWLVSIGQPARLIELFWEPLALAALNQPIDQAVAGPFIAVLQRMFGPSADRAALVLPAVPLDEMYAVPSRDYISARGGEVRLNAPARIIVEDDRVTGVRVRDEVLLAPKVISTAPWFAMSRLFDTPPPALQRLLADAAATGSSRIVTVNLWFDRPVMDDALVGLPGRVFQWVFDKRTLFGRAASHLSLVSSGAADVVARSNEALVDTALREVREALPAARIADVRRALVVRERHATFSLARGQPPRPGTETALDGLLLAGDWVDTGLPATIESAVASGHLAAAIAAGGTP
jgi:squalene-associated FAD-dependent desaturase